MSRDALWIRAVKQNDGDPRSTTHELTSLPPFRRLDHHSRLLAQDFHPARVDLLAKPTAVAALSKLQCYLQCIDANGILQPIYVGLAGTSRADVLSQRSLHLSGNSPTKCVSVWNESERLIWVGLKQPFRQGARWLRRADAKPAEWQRRFAILKLSFPNRTRVHSAFEGA